MFVLSWLVILPASAYAQATLAGTARDASGAVLPGVTVEAASPALIEKARTAVTDGTGQYRLTELPPGTYDVTFTLTGFTTVKRENVAVSGAGVITINADMKVGAVSETITVSGETPVVDIQSARRQEVLDTSVVQSIPVTRGYNAILAAVPSVTGGSLNTDLTPTMRIFTSHGGRGNEGHVQVDGLDVGAAFNGGGVSGYIMDTANAQELQLTLSGGLGEVQTGGINMNIIPKTGGNTFKGQIFGSGAGSWSMGSNLDAQLQQFGIQNPATIHYNYDLSGSLGGPIKRDRLWFFGQVRDFAAAQDIPGSYVNANAGNPNSWLWVPNSAIKNRTASSRLIFSGRITAQVTPKNKFQFYLDHQLNCDQSAYTQDSAGTCRPAGSDWVATGNFGAFQSPEAFTTYADTYQQVRQASWQSTVTSKLLLEAGFSSYVSRWGWMKPPGALTNFTQVTQLAPQFVIFHGLDNYFNNFQSPNVWRASASYVTGSHSMKFGYQGAYLIEEIQDYSGDSQLTYTFLGNNNPISLTMRIAPWQISDRTEYHALYAQDQWTVGRLTVQGALRYDHAYSWFPSDHNGAPSANRFSGPISFPEARGVNAYNDITPRVGIAHDLFGNGKTSLRVNIGKYLQNANNQAEYEISNPAMDGRNGRQGPNFQTTTSRPWTDSNHNFTPDCDLLNPNAQNNTATGGDVCGAWQSKNFANPNALTQVNPAVLSGWGVRPSDWQFGASVQQEIVPRMSVEVGYYRRWFQGFFVNDNTLLGPNDFQQTTLTAPANANLPGGGGYPVTYMTLKPGVQPSVLNKYTLASDYGDYKVYWHGVDVTLNARFGNGFVFQGGTSTGRGVTDYCGVAAQLPEMYNAALTNPANTLSSTAYQPMSACHIAENWLTQFRGLASYTIPKAEVLVSAVVQLKPNASTGPTDTTVGTNGTSLAANLTSGAGPTATTYNLLQPGTVYGPRVNTVDFRAAKVLSFGRTRTTVGFDLYNLFNANPGLTFNQAYGDGTTYLRPTTILNPRFVRFNATVDF